nr:putative effector protein Fos2 [Fusarium oxysporum f. sp. spinaciae]
MVGTIIIMAAFVGLAFNHLGTWERYGDTESKMGSVPYSSGSPFAKPAHNSTSATELGDYYLKYIMKPSVQPTTPIYSPYGAFSIELPTNPKWVESIGKDLCIIDLDSRPFDEPGQLFSSGLMSWDRASETHGLSVGILNHWVYCTSLRASMYVLHSRC